MKKVNLSKKSLKLFYVLSKPAFRSGSGSGSSWIRILLTLLDPDPDPDPYIVKVLDPDPDPDPYIEYTDPQHCLKARN